MKNTDPIPAWAMKLIADAQIPNGRYVTFDRMSPFRIVRWFVRASLRATKAKAIMDAIASGTIPLDDERSGDIATFHG